MKINEMNFSNLKGNEVTLRRTELQQTGSVLKKLGSLYDEHARLLFLFDVSGSMTGQIARTKSGASLTDQFTWTPELLAQIRTDTTMALARINFVLTDPSAMMTGATLDANDRPFAAMADDQRGPQGEYLFNPKDDEDVKERVIRANLINHFGVKIDFTQAHTKCLTRIELVKKLAKSEIQNRFKKFPDSRIAVIPFSGHPVTIFEDGQPADLWPVLDTLSTSFNVFVCKACGKVTPFAPNASGNCPVCGKAMEIDGSDGGTDILVAIKSAIELCRKSPSKVGVHHFIIVTDGEDYVADTAIASWVPALKASGIVIDYIHIGDCNPNAGLKAACAELGGEYVVVNTEKDFQTKFVEAVNRLMLPPAPSK